MRRFISVVYLQVIDGEILAVECSRELSCTCLANRFPITFYFRQVDVCSQLEKIAGVGIGFSLRGRSFL